MARTARTAARAALAAGAAVMLAVGCSGEDGNVRSFKIELPDQDATAFTVFNGALLRATEICGQEDPPQVVRWEFDSDDRESIVAQQYGTEKYPTFIDCTTIQGTPDGSPGGVSVPGAQAQDPSTPSTARP